MLSCSIPLRPCLRCKERGLLNPVAATDTNKILIEEQIAVSIHPGVPLRKQASAARVSGILEDEF